MIKAGSFYHWLEKGIAFSLFNTYFSDAGNINVADTLQNTSPKAFNCMTTKLEIDILKLLRKNNSDRKYDNSNQVNLSINILNQNVYYPEFVRGNINSLRGRPRRAFFIPYRLDFRKKIIVRV